MKPGRKSNTTMKPEFATSRKSRIASLVAQGAPNPKIWAAMEIDYPQTIIDDNRRKEVCNELGIPVMAYDAAERDSLGKAIRQVKGLMIKEDEAVDEILEVTGAGEAKSPDEMELLNRKRFPSGIWALDYIYGDTAYKWTQDAPDSQYSDWIKVIDRKGLERQRRNWLSGSYRAGQFMPAESLGDLNWKPAPGHSWTVDKRELSYIEHGMPEGFLSLWGGAPGVGKTRLALALTRALTKLGFDVLYLNGEAEEMDIRMWLGYDFEPDLVRIITGEHIRLGKLIETVYKMRPRVVIADSLQMIAEVDMKGDRGAQETLTAMKVVKADEEAGRPHFICISQLNKQEQLAGSRKLEHIVDFAALLTKIEGRKNQFRFDVPRKNRGSRTGIMVPFMHTDDYDVICTATDKSMRQAPVYKMLQVGSPIIQEGVQSPATVFDNLAE